MSNLTEEVTEELRESALKIVDKILNAWNVTDSEWKVLGQIFTDEEIYKIVELAGESQNKAAWEGTV
tara:strand:- start:230 stop:430 length:201 start_codon:yes stop_codon:yes gene_type:complete